MSKLADIRSEYSKQELSKASINKNPILQFNSWFNECMDSEVSEPTAMHLATATKDGRPSSRIVLLKEVTDEGFVFYTNYQSRKGLELEQNPHASICFFWQELERQVRAEGFVERTDPDISNGYFASRPRGSQIGAWTSPQSNVIKNRTILEEREKQIAERFDNKEVPRPAQWGGYVLFPTTIEFWQGRPNRLHDRIRYHLNDGGDWVVDRLAP